MLFSAFLGLYFGTFVDHHRKKLAMILSSTITLITFSLASILYIFVPQHELLRLSNLPFWLFIILILIGAVVGNLRAIALSTTVTMLVPVKHHDRANGLVGTTNGISFAVTSIFSGLAVGMLGMDWVFGLSLFLTIVTLVHLLPIKLVEKKIIHLADAPKHIDIKGSIAAIKTVPGLMALVFFATFNNFLGGVFMSLMDAYGLEMVSVEAWGLLWGVISLGFIIGGLAVVKWGLGTSPLRTLFICNIIMWVIGIFFTFWPIMAITAIGLFLYMVLIPATEAAEQTIIQKVVPLKVQGRVFGFAQSVESAASPIMSFLVGPLAEIVFIPYMTTGSGVDKIGSWFGVGPERGMALIFILSGIIGLIVTLICFRSNAYRILSKYYVRPKVHIEDLPLSPLT